MYIYKEILKKEKEIQRINFLKNFLEKIELIKMQKNSRNKTLKILIF